jgi:hypothetical protein
MADVTLDMLGQRVQRVLDGQRRQDDEFHDIKLRLGSIERSMAGLKRDDAETVETSANLQMQVDRLGGRVSRVEHRLEITDA